ncbi:hypothetical protein ABBQ32_003186 [Trebouxia sp. C0010 RCD-2024]
MARVMLSALHVVTLCGIVGLLAVPVGSLSTKEGKIVDANGSEVILKGFALSGFESGFTMTGDVSSGSDSIAHDWRTNMYRAKMMGFNAARLEWHTSGLQASPKSVTTSNCNIASTADVDSSLLPPPSVGTPQPTGNPTLPQDPPAITDGICSSDLPTSSTTDRFVYMANYLCSQGFYVALVYHSISIAYGGDSAIQDKDAWISGWVSLLEQVLQSGSCQNRLILDLINEPDAYGASWTESGELSDDVATYYLDAMDALHEACPTCLLQIQGSGQYAAPTYTNYGDGFCTDSTQLGGNSNPAQFFVSLLGKKYLSQTILAPHVYGPIVSTQVGESSGDALYARLSRSFGYLNKDGFCSGGACHVFPVILGEFNVLLSSSLDVAFWSSLVKYLNNVEDGADGKHNAISSFFIWAWDANADMQFGLGGMVEMDYQTLNWSKMAMLIDNSEQFTYGMGLKPWYLSGSIQHSGNDSTPAGMTYTTESYTL